MMWKNLFLQSAWPVHPETFLKSPEAILKSICKATVYWFKRFSFWIIKVGIFTTEWLFDTYTQFGYGLKSSTGKSYPKWFFSKTIFLLMVEK